MIGDRPAIRRAAAAIPLSLFLLSILATSTFWRLLPERLAANEASDLESFYLPVAVRMLEGQGITGPDGSAATRYPPGYPAVLAALLWLAGRLPANPAALLAGFVMLCVGISAALLYLLARRVYGPLGALPAALLWITYPFALWLTKQPNVELPFVVLLYATVLVFWRAADSPSPSGWAHLAAGLLAGATMLVRPIAVPLGLLLAALLWWLRPDLAWRRKLGLAALVLGGNVLAVLPWEGWVLRQTGRLVPLSDGGVPSARDGLTFAVAGKAWREEIWVPAAARSAMEGILAQSKTGRPQTAGGLLSAVRGEWRKNPAGVLALVGTKAVRSWYATDSGRYETWTGWIQLGYLGLAVWGGWHAWRRGGAARRLAVLVWSLALSFWLMTILALSILRYMVPAMGLLFCLVPAGVESVAARMRPGT